MNKRPDPEGKPSKRGGPAWLGKRPAGGRVKQEPDWKKAKVAESDINAGYKLKRALLWLVCLALFCGFAYYMYPPQNTPLVVFRAAPYDLNMPPLALATEDTVFLKQVSRRNLPIKKTVLFSRKGESQGSDDETPQKFLAELSEVKPTGPGLFTRKNVIIYIAAHGLVNDAGEACLVPPNANPFLSEEWVPLSKFLKDICALRNLRGARKIVILDCNRIGTRWRSGVLDNRFAERLQVVATEVADDNLYIINSTSPGQVAWTAPEYRASVFGHYVARGLRGEASDEHPWDGNRYVVSFFELRDYLQERVDSYVQQRRGARQTPMVIGPKGLEIKRDFPVVAGDYWQGYGSIEKLRSTYRVIENAKELLEAENSPVKAAWAAYWRRLGAEVKKSEADSLPLAWRHGYVLDPIRFARLENVLMALDERLLAGQDYQDDLKVEWEKLASALDDKHWRVLPSAQGVTNLRLEDWHNQANRIQLGDAPEQDRTGDFEQKFKAWRTAADKEAKANSQLDPSERIAALRAMLYRYGLEGAHEGPTEPFNLTELNYLIDFLQLGSRPDISTATAEGEPRANGLSSANNLPVEGHFLRLLKGNVSEPASSQLKTAILARSLAEQAATPLDVRAHYALEAMVNKADQERRQAEDSLYLGDPVSVDGSAPMPNEVLTEQSAARRLLRAVGQEKMPVWDKDNTGYLGAANWSRELTEMFALRDEVWAQLPHWAEWYLRRTRLELARTALEQKDVDSFKQTQNLLVSVMNSNVLLAEQLEQLLKNRKSENDIRISLNSIQEVYQTVRDDWQALRNLAAEDARQVVDAEGNFVKQEGDVWRFDLAMQSPLLANDRVNRLLIKYCNTLERWDNKELPPRASNKRQDEVKFASEKDVDDAFLPVYSDFWVKYHKLLTHKFAGQYQNHLHTLNVPDNNKLDETIRRFPKAAPLWQVLNSVLTDYDKAVGSRAVLSDTSVDLTAREELTQWDRRVRASAFWLPCVILNVSGPMGTAGDVDEVTRLSKLADSTAHPAARLREVDHWHLTCWHSYRLLEDFWGNGQLNDRGRMYFEVAVESARKAAKTSRLPFRYEIPAEISMSKVEDLDELTRRRVRAYPDGLKLAIDNVETQGPKTKTERELAANFSQKGQTDDGVVRFPEGRAGFFLSSPGNYEPLAADTAGWGSPTISPFRAPLVIIDSNQTRLAEYKIPAFIVPEKFPNSHNLLDGRIWYRGHIWNKEFETYRGPPSQGILLGRILRKYDEPRVQVTGDDSPSGAVMFVFDCSYSMIDADNPFAPQTVDEAREQLEKILKKIEDSLPEDPAERAKAVADLKIGLMAYSFRTPHRSNLKNLNHLPGPPTPLPMYYLTTKNHTGDKVNRDNLTKEGQVLFDELGAAEFARKYPHPDLDIDVLAKPTPDWADEVREAMRLLRRENCVGVTPLYLATKRAIEEAAKADTVTRQVIVISDGVNFPNAGRNKGADTFTPNGLAQNNGDLAALQDSLKANPKVSVKVVLFGEVGEGLEEAQLKQLKKIDTDFKNFELDNVPNAAAIGESIWKTFEKPSYKVFPADKPAPDKSYPFREDWVYDPWPSPRHLLQNPGNHKVEAKGPRTPDGVSQEIELTGGELIKFAYRAREKRLELIQEGEDAFVWSDLKPDGNVPPLSPPLVAQILKPAVGQKNEDTRSTTFQIRLRSNPDGSFVRRPHYVWAEIQPNDAKYQHLIFKCTDLWFQQGTSSPIMDFPIEQWPEGVRSAKIALWIRYSRPDSLLLSQVKIPPGATNFATIDTSEDLKDVKFRIEQETPDSDTRIVKIIEIHRKGTPLANLFRTHVYLSHPPHKIDRMYSPIQPRSDIDGEVIHRFEFRKEFVNEILTLEISSESQMKRNAYTLQKGTVILSDWNG